MDLHSHFTDEEMEFQRMAVSCHSLTARAEVLEKGSLLPVCLPLPQTTGK